MQKIEIDNKVNKGILKNELFIKMKMKKNIAYRNAHYIHKIGDEAITWIMKNKLYNRSKRILECMKIWYWDLYRNNKVMDLKSVWRCKDVYCPNCRTVNLSVQVANFRKYFEDMVDYGYMPYFMTLTVPNIKIKDIYFNIDILNKAFYRLWLWLSADIKNGFRKRLFDCKAGVKALEFTINKERRDCHLHIHSILFIDNYSPDIFFKEIPGYYRKISNEQVLISVADIELSSLWTMAVNKVNLSEYNKLYVNDNWERFFKCDIRELDLIKGIYEAFKYSFKDNDLIDYNIFKDVFFGFKGRRIRQSYGKIYKFNLNKDKEIDVNKEMIEIKDYLDFEELPELKKINGVSEIINNYSEYKKVSRFKAFKEFVNVKD